MSREVGKIRDAGSQRRSRQKSPPIHRTTSPSQLPTMAAKTNGPPQEALPNDPLSNFTLPFPSPDPSVISQLWNAAQPFLSCEHADGILHEPTHEVPGASDYLNAVGSSVGSLDLVFKRLGMGGRSIGERGEEAWNVLLPQVMDVIGVSFI